MKPRIKGILKHLIPIPLILFVICAGYLLKPLITQQKAADEEKTDIAAVNSAAATAPELESGKMPEDPPPQEGHADQEPDQELSVEQETPEENIVMLSSDPLTLYDLYAERGSSVTFQCFYEGAEAYYWEYYDMTVRDWTEIADAPRGYDDLGRQVSFVRLEASDENNGMMLRCRTSFPDGKEVTETACLYVLYKMIADITVEEVSMEAEHYVAIHTIPVLVEYADGTKEEITGLWGMHFLKETEQSVEEGVSSTGNYMETITTVIAEVDYLYTESGDNKVRIRYHPSGVNTKKIDAETTLYGTDQNPPVISRVDFSDYRISADSDSVEIMVTVMAEDDITLYPYLQYAVLPKDQELTEDDWRSRNCFQQVFDQNGIWVVYCRDQYGNIGFYEKDVVVTDREAPEILSVTLEKEGWNQSNTIRVDAADALSVTYSFSCAETGEDSGYIERNYYEITHNGTWTVRVRDAAGNSSSEQIHVTCIDSQAPVILGITTQQNNREVQ